jgi:antitoxin ParD1/3/4
MGSLSINLTDRLERLVREKVESGLYNSASEVVREALRLMERADPSRTEAPEPVPARAVEPAHASVRRNGLDSHPLQGKIDTGTERIPTNA